MHWGVWACSDAYWKFLERFVTSLGRIKKLIRQHRNKPGGPLYKLYCDIAESLLHCNWTQRNKVAHGSIRPFFHFFFCLNFYVTSSVLLTVLSSPALEWRKLGCGNTIWPSAACSAIEKVQCHCFVLERKNSNLQYDDAQAHKPEQTKSTVLKEAKPHQAELLPRWLDHFKKKEKKYCIDSKSCWLLNTCKTPNFFVCSNDTHLL